MAGRLEGMQMELELEPEPPRRDKLGQETSPKHD